MLTGIEIRQEAAFSAAHTGLHAGRFEPLHGHTFGVKLYLVGEPNPITGMVADFQVVNRALTSAVDPLRRRVLLAGRCDQVDIHTEAGQTEVTGGGKRYSFPTTDVLVLPVVNTTTEQIAAWLLEQLLPALAGHARLRSVELTVVEASDAAATVVHQFPSP
jgi:6-pyruvoyl-tetrahydropterin synthase